MAGKCIVILLDGTWNDSEGDGYDTNIVRLREIIVESLDPCIPDEHFQAKDRTFTYQDPSGRTQSIATAIYYDRGVGTGGFFDKQLGGAFGAGLERNVRRAYRYLANTYDPGDHVFVLGFSRGAYTARSLVGLISVTGLLMKDACSPVNESKVWHYYRTNRKDRFSSVSSELSSIVHKPSVATIECIAVFDTVGARGIPLKRAWRENRDLFEFHDVELSRIAKRNLQALAIDEHREPFQAAVWRFPKFSAINSVTEQVWFPGSHSDVGGGNNDNSQWAIKSDTRAPDDITLDWMIKRLKHHCPYFPITIGKLFVPIEDAGAKTGPLHDSRSPFYRLFRLAWRSMGNLSENFPRFARQTYVGRDRHSKTINEMVHISALTTWVSGGSRGLRRYQPRNLRLAISEIDKTYGKPGQQAPNPAILVVDWNGKVLKPNDPASAAKVRHLVDSIIS
jgi:hypothetical protein